MSLTIWTIGYGGRRPAEFVERLMKAGVERIADVRISPRGAMGSYTKAKSPQRGIERLLSQSGILYEWLPGLGNPEREDPAMVRFRAEIATEFETRTERLIGLATDRSTCLMCGCQQAASCHRAIIAAWLAERGWGVIDL